MIHHIQTKNSYSTSNCDHHCKCFSKSGHLTELPQLIDVGIDAIYFCRKILHVDVGNKRQYRSDNYKVGNGPP
jgi:hypothetical protein